MSRRNPHARADVAIEQEVLRLATLVPREPGTPLAAGAEERAIAWFQMSQDFPLPLEVVEWLRFSDGSMIGPGGIYGLDAFKRTFAIQPGFKARHWLPLGTDGCGDYYVLALNSEDPPLRPVYFIDPHASNGYDRPTYAVASGFWQFLKFLFQGELSEKRWPFDAAHVLELDPELANVRSAVLPWAADERSRS